MITTALLASCKFITTIVKNGPALQLCMVMEPLTLVTTDYKYDVLHKFNEEFHQKQPSEM